MSQRKFPLKDSEDYKQIEAWVRGGQYNQAVNLLVNGYGFRDRDTALRAIRTYLRIKVSELAVRPKGIEEQELIINVPPIKIRSYTPVKKGKGDPETQVLLLSDHHADEVTSTYSKDVYRQRLQRVFERTLIITELHRNMYPINELVIFMLGDMVHGENPYQGAKLGSATMGGAEQVYELAFPELLSLLCSFRENFKNIKVYCVWGNHGRISREAPRTSNWDNMLYKALEKAQKPQGIEIYPPANFCQIRNIGGFRFFAYHGDQIQAYSGIPYFAQRRKLMNWAATFGGFSYALQGHFHEDDIIRVSAKTKGFINGALVTDDPFALERIGTSGIPCQWTFGVHSHQGLTWAYNITLDDKFLPERVKGVGFDD